MKIYKAPSVTLTPAYWMGKTQCNLCGQEYPVYQLHICTGYSTITVSNTGGLK